MPYSEREKECVCVCVCVWWGGGGACVCAYMHAFVCSRWEGSWVIASTALVSSIVQTAVHLTSYSDCLTGFREPLSPLHGCHTSLKNV